MSPIVALPVAARPLRRHLRRMAITSALTLALATTGQVGAAMAGSGDFLGGVAAGVIGSAIIEGLSQTGRNTNRGRVREAPAEVRRQAPQESPQSKATRQDQSNLAALGHYYGPANGVRTPEFETAIIKYKMAKGQPASAFLSETERGLLDIEARQRGVLEAIGQPDMDPALSPRPDYRVQVALRGLSFYDGALDGKKGPRFARAVTLFQSSIGAPATGILSTEQTVRLMTDAAAEANRRIAAVDRQYEVTGAPVRSPAVAPVYNASAPVERQPAAPVVQAAADPNFDPIEPVSASAKASRPFDIAIVIGNQNYKNGIPEVSFGVRDAEAMKATLINTLGFNPDNVIMVENASQGDLATVFGNRESYRGKVWKYIDPDGRSKVFVFYSGHGMPDVQSKTPYILPVDANPATVLINGYPLALMYSNLEKLKIEKAYVFLDACFSGGSNNKMLIQSASPVFVSAKVDNGTKTDKLTILAASEGDQLASWDEKGGHGLFTAFMLRGLKGEADANHDGKITTGELHGYLLENVRRQARRIYGREQTPVLIGERGDVVSN